MQHMQRPQPAQHNVAGAGFRDFFLMNPPELLGGLNPVVANDWLARIEIFFHEVPYS